jgi:hypothetical protein
MILVMQCLGWDPSMNSWERQHTSRTWLPIYILYLETAHLDLKIRTCYCLPRPSKLKTATDPRSSFNWFLLR